MQQRQPDTCARRDQHHDRGKAHQECPTYSLPDQPERAEQIEDAFVDSLPLKDVPHLYFHDIYRFLYASRWVLAPIYLGLTGALWVMLLVGGDRPLLTVAVADVAATVVVFVGSRIADNTSVYDPYWSVVPPAIAQAVAIDASAAEAGLDPDDLADEPAPPVVTPETDRLGVPLLAGHAVVRGHEVGAGRHDRFRRAG